MINPLFAALGTNRTLSEAAARALSNYKDQPEVLTRLIDYVQRRPPSESARVAAIRAIGSMPWKRSAEFLVVLLNTPDESAAIRTAASDALADLTGLPNGTQDPRRWNQWWERNRAKPEAEFRSDLMARRAVRFDQMRSQFQETIRQLDAIVKDQYRTAAQAQRVDLLLRYLRSPDQYIRSIAADLIYEEALDGKPPAPPVREQLRAMVGDSSPTVRAAVAAALAVVNDAAAFEPLLAQLAQEPDPNVRAALARALAPINDLRAVPVLTAMLDDPSYRAAQAAAQAIKQLGPNLRDSDPALARRTGQILRETLERRTGTPDTVELRQDLVDAMVPLRLEELRPVLTQMLDERRAETVEVRYLAIRAIGEIGNPQSAGVLVTALSDRSDRIRREAVEALAKSPALAENAEPLRDLLDEQKEPDEGVRMAAWRALETVFPSLPKGQLQIWSERFRNDPTRRLIVLKALAQQQLRDRDEDGLSITRENIAAALMSLKEYKEAAEYFGLALQYKKTQNVPAAVESLMRERMRALLQAREYPAAVTFAAQSIQEDSAKAQVMGALIWNEAQRLAEATDLQAALDLIAAAEGMSPPLPERYREELSGIAKQVQARMNQQNGAFPQPRTRTASAGLDLSTASSSP